MKTKMQNDEHTSNRTNEIRMNSRSIVRQSNVQLFVLFLFSYCLLPTAYCFSQGTWTQKADFGGGLRSGAVGFSIGTKGYIGTGEDSLGNLYNDIWEWDQATNVWIQKGNFGGTARVWAVSFSIGNRGYISTGGSTNDFWEYNQSTDTWTQKANCPSVPRIYAIGFSIGSKGYIGTGSNLSGSQLNDFWEWNQSTNTWIIKANLNSIQVAVGFSIGNSGYIGTGYYHYSSTNWDYIQSFWKWDQASNIWTQESDFPDKRGYAVGFSIGNKGYIGTGRNEFSFGKNDFWEYDTTNNSWSQKANFGGVARIRAVGFAIDNRGYIGTGEDANGPLTKDFWEYTPDSSNSINELTLENSVSVFPNPITETATLEIKDLGIGSKDLKMQMYDVNGKMVLQSQILNRKSLIKRGDLPSGIYFLHITSENQSATKKIIIQ